MDVQGKTAVLASVIFSILKIYEIFYCAADTQESQPRGVTFIQNPSHVSLLYRNAL
jgi:hypothetical protein